MGHSVLIVDDSEFARADLKAVLEEKGFQVLEADTGAECCDMVRNNSFDAIFLDYNMPVMNGMDALKRMANENSRGSALVFMMTTETNPDLKNLGKQLGLNGWIVKPVDVNQVAQFLVQRLTGGQVA